MAHFITACEHPNLGLAAAYLDVAPSTLSSRLKSLEQDLGVSLFHKHGSGISPQPAARWLFRAALPLLLLEDFARRYVVADEEAPTRLLSLHVNLSFTFGRVSKAINCALTQTALLEPLTLVSPEWTFEARAPFVPLGMSELPFDEQSLLTIEVIPRPADPAAGEIEIMNDPWVIVRYRREQDQPEPPGGRLMMPALPPLLVAQAMAYVKQHGLGELELLDAHPSSLPQLVEKYSDASFLLPTTTVASRLGMAKIATMLLDPPLSATIVGRADVGDGAALRFLERIRNALTAPQSNTIFKPKLTGRRIRYFNLAMRLGRVSEAARQASVAQPALSQQLQKLERALDVLLFERKPFGLVPTRNGKRFARVATLLEAKLRDITIGGMSTSLSEGGRLSLGVMPSVSQHGLLINSITDAALELHDRYPAMSLAVHEAPNGTLQNWVTYGRVGLAIVETAPPHLPRHSLDAQEELVAIADPIHGLLPLGPISMVSLASLPLVLPTNLFGLRQLVDQAAGAHGLTLRPVHEIDALAMLVSVLRRQPVCTVLPVSALCREIEAGELVASPIVDPVIMRRLFIIYSGGRSLTPAEREFIDLLRQRLSHDKIAMDLARRPC
ncbi:MAG: hypothetical protein JWR80_4842 [Bradyrhizobium sp.]|nr:hypothetical protein [Bradyrhizobium sp.]